MRQAVAPCYSITFPEAQPVDIRRLRLRALDRLLEEIEECNLAHIEDLSKVRELCVKLGIELDPLATGRDIHEAVCNAQSPYLLGDPEENDLPGHRVCRGCEAVLPGSAFSGYTSLRCRDCARQRREAE